SVGDWCGWLRRLFMSCLVLFFFFEAEDGIRDWSVTGVKTCALPICRRTSTPDPARPATTAASRNSPDARGSRPITASGRRPSARAVSKAPILSIAPAAATDRSMASRAVRSRPATPRTPSVPNSRAKQFTPGRSRRPSALACPGPVPGLGPASAWAQPLAELPLGVLRRLAGLLQTVLLALLDPGVAGQEASPLKYRAVLRVDQDQRPGDAQPQRPRLAGDAAAGDPGDDVELVFRAQRDERLA